MSSAPPGIRRRAAKTDETLPFKTPVGVDVYFVRDGVAAGKPPRKNESAFLHSHGLHYMRVHLTNAQAKSSPATMALQRILVETGLAVDLAVGDLPVTSFPPTSVFGTTSDPIDASATWRQESPGLVLSGINFGVDFNCLWCDSEDFLLAASSHSIPSLYVSHEENTNTNVAWAIELAAELAILMLWTPPPRHTALHVAVPGSLSSRTPRLATSTANAWELFRSGQVTVSPLCLSDCSLEFGPEQGRWAHDALRAIGLRLTGHQSACACCAAAGSSVFQSNYSERNYQ